MSAIWKFGVPALPGSFNYWIPEDAKFLALQAQFVHGEEEIKMWFQLDPNAKEENRFFAIVGTGMDFNGTVLHTHLATFQSGPFVWHLYEATEEIREIPL